MVNPEDGKDIVVAALSIVSGLMVVIAGRQRRGAATQEKKETDAYLEALEKALILEDMVRRLAWIVVGRSRRCRQQQAEILGVLRHRDFDGREALVEELQIVFAEATHAPDFPLKPTAIEEKEDAP